MQIIYFIQAHWQLLLTILVIAGLALAAYVDWQYLNLQLYGPRDIVGNGITVGLAKAFDNRSLALRIERLSNSLAQMKVLDQKVTDNIGKVQGSSLSAQTLTLDVKAGVKPATTATATASEKPAATSTTATEGAAKPAGGTDAAKTETKPEVTLAASDILNEQLNLASQILNLQTLYERSLTDRLIGDRARLQTVLGFQVSITPPAGFENCVAVVEVAVRIQPPPRITDKAVLPGRPQHVSLVAMIPQEKTYNAQSISTRAQSIGGSAVASVLSLGLTKKGETRELFIHRDSDTVAFERSPDNAPGLFPDGKATVFGWEFRPVLGRKAVSPGMRQMLAVVALPVPDESEYKGVISLQIKTRSYWRRYDSRNQTSGRKWHWYPSRIDGSNPVDTEVQELAIPNTAKIQEDLEPKVANIRWVNTGLDRATVIVKGENFFPGTKVVAAGKVHREEDGTLTLKSDQALEFETTLAAIASGDAVLSGRFGRSLQLKVHRNLLPVQSLYLTRAVIKQSRRGKDLRISIDVKGLNDDGDDADLKVDDLTNLPEPILFIGNEPLPLPYDYWPLTPKEAPTEETPPAGSDASSGTQAKIRVVGPTAEASATGSGSPTVSGQWEFTFAKPSTRKSIRVEAWIPARIVLSRNTSVMFRVPFCGLDYQASWPVGFFEPTVTRMGADANNTVFRISHSLWHEKAVSVEIDKIYDQDSDELVNQGGGDYRLTVPNTIVPQYKNLVLRIEGAEPYVFPLPVEEKPKPKPTIDLNAKPPQIPRGSIGPAEWTGTDLQMITAATLVIPPTPAATAAAAAAAAPGSSAAEPSPTRTPASFTYYDGGKKIAVYFSDSSANVIGKAVVEFQFGPNAADTIKAPLFISPPPPPVLSV